MGQKVGPHGLRVGIIKYWKSEWQGWFIDPRLCCEEDSLNISSKTRYRNYKHSYKNNIIPSVEKIRRCWMRRKYCYN